MTDFPDILPLYGYSRTPWGEYPATLFACRRKMISITGASGSYAANASAARRDAHVHRIAETNCEITTDVGARLQIGPAAIF